MREIDENIKQFAEEKLSKLTKEEIEEIGNKEYKNKSLVILFLFVFLYYHYYTQLHALLRLFYLMKKTRLYLN